MPPRKRQLRGAPADPPAASRATRFRKAASAVAPSGAEPLQAEPSDGHIPASAVAPSGAEPLQAESSDGHMPASAAAPSGADPMQAEPSGGHMPASAVAPAGAEPLQAEPSDGHMPASAAAPSGAEPMQAEPSDGHMPAVQSPTRSGGSNHSAGNNSEDGSGSGSSSTTFDSSDDEPLGRLPPGSADDEPLVQRRAAFLAGRTARETPLLPPLPDMQQLQDQPSTHLGLPGLARPSMQSTVGDVLQTTPGPRNDVQSLPFSVFSDIPDDVPSLRPERGLPGFRGMQRIVGHMLQPMPVPPPQQPPPTHRAERPPPVQFVPFNVFAEPAEPATAPHAAMRGQPSSRPELGPSGFPGPGSQCSAGDMLQPMVMQDMQRRAAGMLQPMPRPVTQQPPHAHRGERPQLVQPFPLQAGQLMMLVPVTVCRACWPNICNRTGHSDPWRDSANGWSWQAGDCSWQGNSSWDCSWQGDSSWHEGDGSWRQW